jgi:hypothetical protein
LSQAFRGHRGSNGSKDLAKRLFEAKAVTKFKLSAFQAGQMNRLISILLIASCTFLGGCGRRLPAAVSLNGVQYALPPSQVTAAVFPPNGRLFVRLSPPDTAFHLILDEWSDLPSHQGPNVPRISRLNDVRFQRFSVTQFPSGPVVCTERQPHYNCGFQVLDGPVKWSVLFDRKELPQAEELRRQAVAIIKGYRTASVNRK